MGQTFSDKFEAALAAKRETDPNYGLRTIAREMAGEDKRRVETIRRQLHRYRPPKGGGAAEFTPTEPTRREIERAMGLPPDGLKPDLDQVLAARVRAAADERKARLMDDFLELFDQHQRERVA